MPLRGIARVARPWCLEESDDDIIAAMPVKTRQRPLPIFPGAGPAARIIHRGKTDPRAPSSESPPDAGLRARGNNKRRPSQEPLSRVHI